MELGRWETRKSEQKSPQPKHSLWHTYGGALTGTRTPTEKTVASIIPARGQAAATEAEIFSKELG